MDEFTNKTVEGFLDELAGRSPTPGGGSATGVAGALACAQARMVAAYSVGKKTDPAIRARVESINERLSRADELMRALITQDAVAYQAMTQAAKAAREDPARKDGHQQAVLAAVAVPMEMAALISNALVAMDDLKEIANKYLLSDLGIAAALSRATAESARYTVRVNAPQIADSSQRETVLREIDEMVSHAALRRKSIETFVGEHLE